VDALLERNAFQAAVVPDEAVLRQARQALAAVPLSQRVLARLVREAAAEPLQPPDAWFGSLYPLLFEVRAGAGSSPPMNVSLLVNPLFTRAGYTRHIQPRLEATLQALADEEDWVLGQGPRRRESLRADPAARSALVTEVARLYATAYADHWQALLGARQLVRPADADALARLNAQLAGADSPLRKLLALARTELRLVDGSGGPGAAAAVAADAVLAERFAALRSYADGPGTAALDRLLGEVSRFTLASRGGSGAQADSALVRSLQQDAATSPAPFSGVWSRLAEAVQVSGQAALRQGMAARLEDVAGQCRTLTHQRYPFAAAATGNDLGLADFARLFGPEGVLDSFFRRELLPHVDTGSRPWRYRGGAAVAGEAVLRSFERAEDIRRTFFAPNSPVPRLQFTLRPIEMDESLEEFSMDIDGQTLLYENGPRLVRSFTWPGPAGGQRVTLRARGLRGEGHEGPWALLRVLTRQPWTRGESAPDSRATVTLEGRRLVLEIGVRGGGSTAVLAGLASFRCPEGRP
jgi:type VI secretion system protein ImpL